MDIENERAGRHRKCGTVKTKRTVGLSAWSLQTEPAQHRMPIEWLNREFSQFWNKSRDGSVAKADKSWDGNYKVEDSAVILTLPIVDGEMELTISCGNKFQVRPNKKRFAVIHPADQGSIARTLQWTLNRAADTCLAVRIITTSIPASIRIHNAGSGHSHPSTRVNVYPGVHPTGVGRETDVENSRGGS
jgi:hypothetical protein